MKFGFGGLRSVQPVRFSTVLPKLESIVVWPFLMSARLLSRIGLVTAGRLILALIGHAGSSAIKYRIGCELEAGEHFPVDPFSARRWLKKAADRGHVQAMLQLSRLYLLQHPAYGMIEGIAKEEHRDAPYFRAEPVLARQYAIRAADTGHSEGLNLAGYLLSTGQGGPVDIATALKLYGGAVAAGHPDASIGLGTLFMTGKTGKVDHASARGCFRIAASSGNSFARYSLGMMLLNGLGGPADESEAIGLFAAAARKGHIPSMRQLAKWHLEEDRSENQRRAGIAWLRKLAHLDDLASILDLINRHQRGLDVEQSASEARKWLKKAAALGDTQSQFELAQAHVNGDFEGADVATAISLFKLSAEAGHPLAQWHLERIIGPAPKPPERKPGFDFGFGKKTAA